jgi:hypothetical protein
MTKPKTLVGPGYYNLNHTSHEAIAPSFTFDQETSQMFNQQSYADYMHENQEIALNRATRNRREKIKRPLNIDKNPKDQMMQELVNIVEDGGIIDREDAELLIDKIKYEHKQVMAPKLKTKLKGNKQPPVVVKVPGQHNARTQNTMSKVPRWGALTFEEKVDNDMVLNRMKDCT